MVTIYEKGEEMKKTILISAIAALMMGSAANAQGLNKYEVGLQGILENADQDSALKDNFGGFGARANYRLEDNWLVGLGYQRFNSPKSRVAGYDTDLDRYFLNAIYEVNPQNSFVPYAIAGVGYQDVHDELPTFEKGAVAQLGVGFKKKLLEYLNVGVEARYIRDFKNTNDDFALGAFLSIPFGYEVAAAPAPKPAPKDSDGDGVVDNMDKCPGTPAGVQVDSNGCPLDSDHDGVADYMDKCPGTPAGVQVDSKGCALDSDHDGVADYLDKCPGTPKGFQVDDKGCPVIYNFQVNFDFNSAKIKPEYMPKIEAFAEFLKKNPAYKAEIQGYTDNVGSAAYNLKLSERRAKAVYEKLIELGIDKERLTYKGYGEANPIAPNTTPEGRAKNRRVEAHLYY